MKFSNKLFITKMQDRLSKRFNREFGREEASVIVFLYGETLRELLELGSQMKVDSNGMLKTVAVQTPSVVFKILDSPNSPHHVLQMAVSKDVLRSANAGLPLPPGFDD